MAPAAVIPNNGNRFGTTDLWMLLTTLIWAVNLSVLKFSMRKFSILGFNGIRMALASLLLLGILAISKKEKFAVSKSDFWKIAGLGILGTTIYQLIFMEGLRLSTASTTSMIAPMTPVFIALLSHYFKFERISWVAWAGIAVSFLGFYLIMSGKNGSFAFSRNSARGDVLVLVGGFIWAAYTVFSKPLLGRISALKLTVLTTSIGTLLYLPFAAPKIAAFPWRAVTRADWGAILYSAVFAVVIGFVVWYKSVQKVGNTKTGIYSNLNPVFATIFAFFFLGERITTLQAVGGCIIFAGVYLTRSGDRLFRKNAR